jgi:hypothetical protein
MNHNLTAGAKTQLGVRVIRADGRVENYGKPGSFRFWCKATLLPALKRLGGKSNS